MAEIIKLICPSCGGKLEAPQNDSRFACLYCGSQLQVLHRDGEKSVTPFTEAITTMRGSMDRAASEMAIKRIQSELDTLIAQRQPYLSEWKRLKAIHDGKPHHRMWVKIFLWALPASIVLLVVGAVNDVMAIGLIAVLIFFGALIALIMIGIDSGKRKLANRSYDKMAEFMLPLFDRTEKKQQELAGHRRIVETNY